LYSSPNLIRIIKSQKVRWAGHTAALTENNTLYRMLMRTPEGKRALIRPRHRRKDNNKMDLREMGWGVMDWIHQTQGRGPVVGSEHGNESSE
jgi:hypothetical protein